MNKDKDIPLSTNPTIVEKLNARIKHLEQVKTIQRAIIEEKDKTIVLLKQELSL